jgi:hypothetical protein
MIICKIFHAKTDFLENAIKNHRYFSFLVSIVVIKKNFLNAIHSKHLNTDALKRKGG